MIVDWELRIPIVEINNHQSTIGNSPYTHPALLPHELLHVIGSAGAASGRAARLPAAKGIDAGPRAGGRAGAAVGVRDASLDAAEELLDLPLVFRENSRSQTVLGLVGEINRLVERQHVGNQRDRDKKLFVEQRMA